MKLNDQISIDWHHNVENKTTSCVLTVTEKQGNMSFPREFVAISKCGHGDQFSRKAGRKITLTRVLSESGLNKATRTEIWSVLWSKGVKI